MDKSLIADDHDLLRDCKPSSLNKDKSWPTATAFFRKEEHKNLSVNDVSMCSGGSINDRVSQSKELIETRRKLGPNGLLALLNTGSVHRVDAEPPLEVLPDPEPLNPNHCGIYNVPSEEEALTGRASIVEELVGCVVTVWRVKDV